MPKVQSNIEILERLEKEAKENKADFGYAIVFLGGVKKAEARSEQEFAELMTQLNAEVAQGQYANPYAKYTAVNGKTYSLGKKQFSEIPAPRFGEKLSINL